MAVTEAKQAFRQRNMVLLALHTTMQAPEPIRGILLAEIIERIFLEVLVDLISVSLPKEPAQP